MSSSIETTLQYVDNHWEFLILETLKGGSMRFSEIKRIINKTSSKTLTIHLRNLEERGLISRNIYPEVPLRVEYSLTPLGLSLSPVLDAMASWGNQIENKL